MGICDFETGPVGYESHGIGARMPSALRQILAEQSTETWSFTILRRRDGKCLNIGRRLTTVLSGGSVEFVGPISVDIYIKDDMIELAFLIGDSPFLNCCPVRGTLSLMDCAGRWV